jgi:hypothetical protein
VALRAAFTNDAQFDSISYTPISVLTKHNTWSVLGKGLGKTTYQTSQTFVVTVGSMDTTIFTLQVVGDDGTLIPVGNMFRLLSFCATRSTETACKILENNPVFSGLVDPTSFHQVHTFGVHSFWH